MDYKKLALGLTLTAAFGLIACGDDDSSPVAPSTEKTVSSSSVGTAGDVTSSGSQTAQNNSGNVAVSSGGEMVASSSSFSMMDFDLGDMGEECAKEGEKKDGKVMGMDTKLICQGGVWAADTAAMREGLKCSPEGSTKDTTMMGMTTTLVCKDGQWGADYSCTTEGATKEMDFMGSKMTLVCKNGEWTMDVGNIDLSDFGGQGDGVITTGPVTE